MGDSYVYFALKGESFDPDIVTKRIGLIPKKVHRKGDSSGNNGNKVKFSGWYYYSGLKENILVDSLVEDVVDKLFDKIEIINQLKSEFNLTSILEIVLYIDFNEEVSTPAIGHNLKTIEFLYKTGTETDVDIYKFDSTGN